MIKASCSSFRLKAFAFVKQGIDRRRDLLCMIPGLMRLYYFAYRALKPKGIVLAEAQGLKIYVNAADDVIAPELLVYGSHEKFETELVQKTIKPSSVFVDVGANIGYYSLIAAKIVGECGKVYSFEPDPANFKLLQANIEANRCTNIVPIQRVVSNEVATVKLFLDKGNFGAHTLTESNIQTERGGFVEVEAITLDAFFKEENNTRVDFIKMDVQGSEGLVLEQAHEVLTRNDLKLLMEFWPQGLRNMGTDPAKLLEKLQEYGFSIRVLMHESAREEKSIPRILEVGETEGYVNLFLEKGVCS